MDIQYNGPGDVTTYQYKPNGAAAIIFIAGFGINFFGHFFEMCRLRTAYFLPLIIGCLSEYD